MFSSNGISAHPQKVIAIKNAPSRKSVKDVRTFLGMSTHCAKFSQNFSDLQGRRYGGAWGAALPLASGAVGNFLNFVLLSANQETFCFRKYFVGNISRPIRKSTSLPQQMDALIAPLP